MLNTEFDFDAEIQKTEYLVEGMFPFNSISFVLGRPGSGKSFITEQLAMSVITGQDFMGHKVEQGNVLLIDQDTASDALSVRLQNFKEYYGNIGRGKLFVDGQKHYYNISDNSLINVINNAGDISLVIIDSLHKITTGLNPNDTKDMSNIAKLRRCNNKRMSIVIVHHIGKTNTMSPEAMMVCSDPTVLFMGNTVISAEADSYFIITSPDAGKSKYEHIWIRPVAKRFTLNQETFIANFEQTDSIYHLSFGGLYENADLLPSIEQDIITLFEQSPKIRVVKEVYNDMGDMYGINGVRDALHNLEAKRRLICHRGANNIFRYELETKKDTCMVDLATGEIKQ